MPITHFLEQKYPGEAYRKLYRDEIARVCNAFIDSGHADSKFQTELTSGSDSKFWSCISEALIYQRVCNRTMLNRLKRGVGPDFLLTDGKRNIWVEVICPRPAGVHQEWLEINTNTAGSVPHEAILLRWTSAIKEKTEKLIGDTEGKVKGYLSTGIVSDEDIYVIAINGCQLRHGPFPALHGISQFPYAAEAVFPIGPFQIRIDRETLKSVGTGYQERYSIPKPNGSSVPSHAFLDPRYKMVSAIWAVDLNCATVIGNPEPSALIHNPNAANPLPPGFLLADDEFVATPGKNNDYTFARVGVTREGDG